MKVIFEKDETDRNDTIDNFCREKWGMSFRDKINGWDTVSLSIGDTSYTIGRVEDSDTWLEAEYSCGVHETLREYRLSEAMARIEELSENFTDR